MQPDLRAGTHEPLRAAQPGHPACRRASRAGGHKGLEAFQPDRFADLNSRNQAASVALQTDHGGGERTSFREELLAVVGIETACTTTSAGLSGLADSME